MSSRTSGKRRLAPLPLPKSDIVHDYRVAFMSRQASLLGRKEVLSGKAKFGIFGDGKEVAQVALARAFHKGDWRSGYYRDQTLIFALGISDVRKYFAQLYADPNVNHEPATAGRQMNGHFSSRYIDEGGQWLNQTMMFNSSADMSPTASQMGRLLGLAYASKLYREHKDLNALDQFSINGNEVAFGTIGDASTSEGIFWETLNAAGVLQVPLAMNIWDDGYGISVPRKFQTTKDSISEALSGFQRTKDSTGFDIYQVKAWDYPDLVETYHRAIERVRKEHIPAIFHVQECTQPQGHSTSGSHERYKTDDRLKYESEMDGLKKMRAWMEEAGVATSSELDLIEQDVIKLVKDEQKAAWKAFISPIEAERKEILDLYHQLNDQVEDGAIFDLAAQALERVPVIHRRDIQASLRRTLIKSKDLDPAVRGSLQEKWASFAATYQQTYSSHLLAEISGSPLRLAPIAATYDEDPERVDGRVLIQRCFDHHLSNDPRMFIIGEDVGKLGGVNLEFEGLQEKHGFWRITDTGIREATILGQGIGAAMRGLRPIVDIQYLDYLLYCFQLMSDDLATLHYRSAGSQLAPVIVRTKGHRLEGIWHTGSPMGTILNGLRGIHVCVPRNMTQAVGMYNTLLQGDDPALVVEVLNGYRVKEMAPNNLTEFRVPLGVPDVIRTGSDLTIVTYGACTRVADEAIQLLGDVGADIELIDVQTLLPFDTQGVILDSIKKTNAVMFLDEDVPGGASSFMMQNVLERDGAYDYLDAAPITLSAAEHRAAYGSDGDYYSKPNAEDIFDKCYELLHERDPQRFPSLV